MRAYFYFRLAKFSAEFLLLQKTDGDRTVPRASYTETFAQIQHCSPGMGMRTNGLKLYGFVSICFILVT
jgi:hypothetical protein